MPQYKYFIQDLTQVSQDEAPNIALDETDEAELRCVVINPGMHYNSYVKCGK
jgi:hypothetical protein